jgi:hypothetical protein
MSSGERLNFCGGFVSRARCSAQLLRSAASQTRDPGSSSTSLRDIMFGNAPIPEMLLQARKELLQQRQQCFDIYAQYMKLIAQRRILSETYDAEVRGRGETGKAGEGPVAKSVQNQISELAKEMENLTKSYSDTCDFELPL